MNVKAMAEQMRMAGHYECDVAAHDEGAFYDWAVQVEALQQQLAAAREALKSAEADAARYLWMRDHADSNWTVPQVFAPFTLRFELPFWHFGKALPTASLDYIIDAARGAITELVADELLHEAATLQRDRQP